MIIALVRKCDVRGSNPTIGVFIFIIIFFSCIIINNMYKSCFIIFFMFSSQREKIKKKFKKIKSGTELAFSFVIYAKIFQKYKKICGGLNLFRIPFILLNPEK